MITRYDVGYDGVISEFQYGEYVLHDDYERLKLYADIMANEISKFNRGERAHLERALLSYEMNVKAKAPASATAAKPSEQRED